MALDDVIGENETTVKELLRVKHPQQQPIIDSSLLHDPVDEISSVIFDKIDGVAICFAALRTQGAAGPSGVDSVAWRRLCCSFQMSSTELCNSLAAVASRLWSEFVDPHGIQAFVACRLIPLDK